MICEVFGACIAGIGFELPLTDSRRNDVCIRSGSVVSTWRGNHTRMYTVYSTDRKAGRQKNILKI